MNIRKLTCNVLFAALIGVCAADSNIASAQSTGELAATATVTSSATLTLSNLSGNVSTLTFAGTGATSLSASEGTIDVGAQITTTAGNSSAIIQIASDANLVGTGTGTGEDAIPFTDVTYTAADAGGAQTATWSHPALGGGATSWSTLAALTPGSGTYLGHQVFTLAVPATAVVDTYTGNVYYQITGF